MSQVNITLNTNTVDINTTNNQIVVTDPTNPNVVNITQPVTSIVEVITAGPQGPPGSPGTGSMVDTGSFVTTGSFNAFTSSYNTGSFTGSFTGNLIGTSSWATNALTASYLSGYVSPFPFTGSAIITGSLGITGSLSVTQGITGSLSGTASFAVSSSRAVTSSFAITSSFAVSSSYALSSSFSISSSWAPLNAGGSDTQIQFNSGSALLGTGSFTFNYQSQSLQQGFEVTASGLYSHAEGSSTQAIGEVSHAEGNITKAIGDYSHAEGDNTQAKGNYSHAEGQETIASGSYSHAEGYTTIAIGERSHAEGFLTIASGSYSHAEGADTQAIGQASHAEGRFTIATGIGSHAEGYQATALGSYSHAEGLGTITSGSYQHTQGQYNISSSAQSAFIIGNGTDDNNRSNLVFAVGNTVQVTGSLQVSGSITGSLFGTASYALNALSSSFASTASFAPAYLPLTGGTISGSLTINSNLIVLGSASIQYISESTLNIGTNLITVNTFTPAVRFGGLAVIDSGSSPQVSASFLYDSVQDEFIFVHKGTAAGATTSSVFLLGPETYNNLGNETYLTANRIPKGTGIEHLNDSNISDNGSVVSINSNTQITGSLVVTAGITGSFSGSGANLNSIPASAITGLNLSQIATGSVTASVLPGTGSFQITSGSTSLLFISSSGNVGIGTNTPLFRLDVSGTARIQQTLTSGGGTPLALTGETFALQTIVATGAGGSVFGTNASNPSFIDILSNNNFWHISNRGTTLGGNNRLGIYNASFTGATATYSNELITILTSGLVGIGTTSPQARLDVRAQGASATDIAFRVRNSADSANLLTVIGANAVTIGNTSEYTYKDTNAGAYDGVGVFSITGAAGKFQMVDAGVTSQSWNFIQENSVSARIRYANINAQMVSNTAGAETGIMRFYTKPSATSVTEGLRIWSTQNVSIQSGGTFTDAGFRLDVSGSTRLNGNTTITGSLNVTGSSTLRGTVNITPATSTTSSLVVTGPTLLSGSQNTISGSVLTVVGSGSAQPVFTVQGSQGELFSITDSLSGSLFSVNDISGLPIMEVFSDGTTLMGDYLDPMLITTKKVTLTGAGAFTIYSLPTASYDTAFFDYSVRSGSNARAGQIMAIQSASVVNYTETTTMDFGSTSGLSLGVFVSGSNMVLTGSAATSAWTIKTIIRSI